MAEYIEREKVTELIDYYQEDYFEAEAYFGLLKEDFLKLPPADVQPVKHGRWVLDNPEQVLMHCSNCNWLNLSWKWKYCPNCGALMGDEDDV